MSACVCYRCGNEWQFSPPYSRTESCEKCNWDARCCRNCKFHDKNAYRECRESQAEFVADKEKNNFCSYFFPSSAQTNQVTEADKAKQKLDNLFGGSENSFEKADSNSSLDDQLKALMSKK